jgi:hypothetical protein
MALASGREGRQAGRMTTDASCHCGAVRFSVQTAPAELNSCQCSICRRHGGLWAYYSSREVTFAADNGPTDVYIWGDRDLTLHRCRTCGCVTHWLATDPTYDRMGVNGRMMAAEVVAAASVRISPGPP